MFTTSEFTSPPRRSRKPAAIAVAVAVVAALVAVTVTLTHHGGQGGTAAPAVVGHDPDPGAPDYLTAAPVGLQWVLADGVPVPVSPVDGPRSTAGDIATGYAHSPQGAVIAALQIGSRAAFSDNYEAILASQCAGTTDELQAQFISTTAPNHQVPLAQRAAMWPHPAAFKMVEYVGFWAAMYFAYPNGHGGYRFAPESVNWDDQAHSWRWQLDSGIDARPDSADLTGFTTL